MSKGIGFFALAALLSGCFSSRMQPAEKVLGFQPKQAKIYILSAIPHDTSDVFLSTLVMQHENNNVVISSYTREIPIDRNVQLFADSAQSFDPTTFPVIVKAVNNDSTLRFRFSLDRDEVSFSSEDTTMSFTLSYPKQQPFDFRPATTDFRISAAESFPAILDELNGKTLDQSSVVTLHVMDNSAPIFGQKDQKRFYWLDCQINDSLTHSLFFETAASGETTILYTTFPPLKGVEITSEGLSIALVNGTMLVSPFEEMPLNTYRSHWVGAVKLLQNGIMIGNGILYKL